MKRTAFDERRDNAIASDYLANHLACRKCGAMTDREALMNFGGQCGRCYDALVSELTPGWLKRRQLTVEERARMRAHVRKSLAEMGLKSPKAWAYSLKAREESGEKLLPVQAKAWRDALHFRGEVATEDATA